MKTKRVLSALLAVVMIVPLCLLGITYVTAAEEATVYKPLTVENLGWSTDCGYGTQYVGLTLKENYDTDGNNALLAETLNTSWGSAFEVLSAEKMSGVTQYTISMDMEFTYAAMVGFILNNDGNHASTGDWCGYNWSSLAIDGTTATMFESRYYDKTNVKSTGCKHWTLSGNNKGTLTVNVVLATDADTPGTVTTTYVFADTSRETLTTTHSTYATAADVRIMFRGAKNCYIDNIKVVNDETEETIYSEDFESFTYAGKDLGEIVYSQNFDSLSTIESAAFTYADSGMGTATVAMGTNPNDGTQAAKVSGSWVYTEIVPAAALSHYDVYTVTLNASVEGTMDRFTLMHNITTPGASGGSGWAAIRQVSAGTSSTYFENTFYSVDNSLTKTGNAPAWTPTNFEFALTVNKKAGTATIHYNGIEISTCAFDATAVKDSPIGFNVQGSGAVYIDDISVNVGVYQQPTAGSVLYRQDFDSLNSIDEAGFAYSGGGMREAILGLVQNAPVNGTNAMTMRQNGDWSYAEIVPATVIKSSSVYTIIVNAVSEGTVTRFTLMHDITTSGGGGGSNNGWCAIRSLHSGPWFENYYYASSGQINPTTTGYSTAWTNTTGFEFAITVDKAAGTATMYYNGVQISTCTFGVTNAKDSPIALMMQGAGTVYVDDILAVAGTYDQASIHNDPHAGTVLLEENFNSQISWRRTNNVTHDFYLALEEDSEGNRYVGYQESAETAGWKRSFLEIASEERMQHFLKSGDVYTISLDVNVLNLGDHIYIGFAGERVSTNNGYFLYLNTSGVLKIEGYVDGTKKDATSKSASYTMNQFNTIEVQVNTDNGEIQIWLNDTPVVLSATSDANPNGYIYYGTNTDISTVWFSMGSGAKGSASSSVQIDNVKVTKGARGENLVTICDEDFEDCDYDYNQGNYKAAYAYQTVSYAQGSGAWWHKKSSASDRWTEMVLVEDGVTNGLSKYTINFDLYALGKSAESSTPYVDIRFGSNSIKTGSQGAWLRLDVKNKTLHLKEAYDYSRSQAISYASLTDQTVTVSIEVDTEAKIVKVYLNGELVLTSSKYSYLVSGGCISFGSDRNAEFYVDNLSIVAGSATDAPADYYGAQLGVGKSTDAIRFVGTLGKKYTTETVGELTDIGFHITASYNGVTEYYDDSCYYLFDRLKAYDSLGITHTEYTAAQLGGEHIFALTIYGIPASAGTVTFTVTPYFQTEKGEATGTTWIVVYDAANHAIISQTIQ